jgi:hypothetical protein
MVIFAALRENFFVHLALFTSQRFQLAKRIAGGFSVNPVPLNDYQQTPF